MLRSIALVLTPCLLMAATAKEKTPDGAAGLKVAVKPEQLYALYRSQLIDVEWPVGSSITFGGATIPTSIDDKGALSIDIKNDGKPKKISSSGLISLPLGSGPIKSAQIAFTKNPDKTWSYRNATQLTMQIGPDLLVIVDANANGIYNEAGVDGMTWKDYTWLYPLPAAEEHWCTPSAEIHGISFGPVGENMKVTGTELKTTLPETLDIIKGINVERIKLGLTPRPEDPSLSAPLQAHCHYMALNHKLDHPEDPSKPGYTKEGHEAGMRSILSGGGQAGGIAARMVQTYFHRQDVIRPFTLAFGVGYEGYGGIDGRTNLGKGNGPWRPILCPVPDQTDIPTRYGKEMPDATPGDDQAGYPITVYFGTSNLSVTKHSLTVKGSKAEIDCYVYDPHTGASADFSGWQQAVALIAKDSLPESQTFEVSLEVSVDGKPWTNTWSFTTGAAPKSGRK